MIGTMYSLAFDWNLNITNYKLSNADFRREKERVGSREKLSLMKTKFIMTNSCLPATYTNRFPLKLNLFSQAKVCHGPQNQWQRAKRISTRLWLERDL